MRLEPNSKYEGLDPIATQELEKFVKIYEPKIENVQTCLNPEEAVKNVKI